MMFKVFHVVFNNSRPTYLNIVIYTSNTKKGLSELPLKGLE